MLERCSGNAWPFSMPEQRSSVPVFHPGAKCQQCAISVFLLAEFVQQVCQLQRFRVAEFAAGRAGAIYKIGLLDIGK